MKIDIIKNKNIFNAFLSSVFLWLCIWATYDTDINRLLNPGFPHNALDLIHGLRSLLPLLALIISIVILFKKRSLSKKIFTTPLGLLGIFTTVGIFSSIFSKNPFMALYWGFLYGSLIVVLLTVIENKDLLKKIIIINLIIAGILAVGLTLFFFIQPGAVSSLTFNFLICAQRPYEGLGGVSAAVNTFGVAGTRPTGLGRYAGFLAIVALVGFLCAKAKSKNKYFWFVLFILFLFVLLFSKGKTEILAFITAMLFAGLITKKINIFSVLGATVVILLSFFIIFYNVPCTNNTSIISSIAKECVNVFKSKITTPISKTTTFTSKITTSVSIPCTQNTVRLQVKNISTLSGRSSGVWHDARSLFLKNPLLGFGFQADRFFLGGQNAQNSIIHALIEAGILGTIPFILAFILTLIMLIRLFKNNKIGVKERNFMMMMSAALVFFAVRSITESVAFFSADWLFVAPIIAYIQCLDSQLKKESNNLQMDFRGNKIDLVKISDAVERIKYWIKNESQKLHWVVVTGMHGIVEAAKHADFKYIISNADMFVPDGISLVWLAKLKGFDIKKRVSGADLMQEFIKVSEKDGFKNFFYGDTEETLKELRNKFPKVNADFYSPPFRELTQEEDEEIIKKINQAKPDVLWVGLGLPKQEKWIFSHREKLNVPVVIGVGAAFKFLSGKVRRAPKWIGSLGFEWLWRLIFEFKTAWKRVFFDIPFFFWLVVKDFLFENS